MKNLTWQNPEQLFVAQELINKVKSKCCGIKGKEDASLAFLLNKIGKISKKIPDSFQFPVSQDETTGELIYQTYTVTAVMNNNVLSIDCGNAAAEIGIPNLSITYENIDD